MRRHILKVSVNYILIENIFRKSSKLKALHITY